MKSATRRLGLLVATTMGLIFVLGGLGWWRERAQDLGRTASTRDVLLAGVALAAVGIGVVLLKVRSRARAPRAADEPAAAAERLEPPPPLSFLGGPGDEAPTSPRRITLKYCAECGELEQVEASACRYCGGEFPRGERDAGAVKPEIPLALRRGGERGADGGGDS